MLQVNKRITANTSTKNRSLTWCGNVWAGGDAIVQDSKHRPQDLRALHPACLPDASARFQVDDDSDDDEALMDMLLHTEHVIATQRPSLPTGSTTGAPCSPQHQ